MSSSHAGVAIVARSLRVVAGGVLAFAVASAITGCASHRDVLNGSLGMMQNEVSSRKVTDKEISEALTRGCEILVERQRAQTENGKKNQWPYEGVYRVAGEIPMGYRIGGTAICTIALARAPGFETDPKRAEAVARAVEFLCTAREHPTMSEKDYTAGYDVRAWGYIYSIECIARLKQLGRLPEAQAQAADDAMKWYIDALQKVEIPQVGGWNYARPRGRDTVAPPSPFMTGPAIQALWRAKEVGYEIDQKIIDRALDFLERSRAESGSVVYSGDASERSRDLSPGAVGRMVVVESTLSQAKRSKPRDVRGAVDAFIVHWDWLKQRKQQNGTHVAPYGVAPYYFMFAHYYAAQAIEELPAAERPEYRRRVNALLFSVREEDGSWNDRVFDRSAAYGTAMAMMAMQIDE
jgi:hypothetical protein